MQLYFIFLSLLSSSIVFLEVNAGKNWAVLVAGSNGWPNYRHHADVCHAYQVLRKNGFAPENIITMLYNDVPYSRENPHRGKIFHDNKHVDVYEGVKVDYSGLQVSVNTFVPVLEGDMDWKKAGFKVLESGPDDNVFVYFTDHGAENLLLFPYDPLDRDYATYLFQNLKQQNKFKNLLFYVDASYSGSMFANALPSNISVLVMTATNERETSHATFCEDPEIKTCLADEFSYQWITDIEKDQLSQRTIEQHFSAVRSAVKQSHVTLFGDMNIAKLPLSEFFSASKKEDSQVSEHLPSA